MLAHNAELVDRLRTVVDVNIDDMGGGEAVWLCNAVGVDDNTEGVDDNTADAGDNTAGGSGAYDGVYYFSQ